MQAEELELSWIQVDILHALITLYKRKGESPVRAEEVAELIQRSPGTVRNQMQTLRTLGLVEGVPGPKGGYAPTVKVYKILTAARAETSIAVPVIVNDEPVEGLSAEEIVLPSLSNPKVCQAIVRILGDIGVIRYGDRIVVGPTPVNGLTIAGVVVGRSASTNSVIISVDRVLVLPNEQQSQLEVRNNEDKLTHEKEYQALHE